MREAVRHKISNRAAFQHIGRNAGRSAATGSRHGGAHVRILERLVERPAGPFDHGVDLRQGGAERRREADRAVAEGADDQPVGPGAVEDAAGRLAGRRQGRAGGLVFFLLAKGVTSWVRSENCWRR